MRLYGEPWIYYRAVQALAPGAVTSVGMLPHHELLLRVGAGRRFAPDGWVDAKLNIPFGRGLPCRMIIDLTWVCNPVPTYLMSD